MTYTAAQIAKKMGKTTQAVNYRAKKEDWPFTKRPGKGGGKLFALTDLPEDVRVAIMADDVRQVRQEQAVAKAKATPPAPIPMLVNTEDLDDARIAKANFKADLVRLYLGWLRNHGKSEYQREQFMAAYHGGTWPDILKVVGFTSWKSLERWKKRMEQTRTALINVDKRGLAHRGKTLLTGEHTPILLGQILDPNAPKLSEMTRNIQARCEALGLHVPSSATIKRFQDRYFRECYDEWVWFREGKKAFTDKASISILRDWSLVQVGDVVIADGHTLNFETVHPQTGKPKRMTLLLFFDGASSMPLGWEIMPSENIACISAAFRRTVIFLGKVPLLVYIDNGKAFRAKYFKGCPDLNQAGIFGLYEGMGCTVTHAWAYHGQSKPIERFFETMHDMEVAVPSYVGTCIDDKPARMNRGEVKHRALYEKTGGRPLTLEETHRAVADWFARYAGRPSRAAHLDGRTPMEVFRAGKGPGLTDEELRRMDALMMTAEVKAITKDGIRVNKRLFWHQALQSRRHSVVVRYDQILSPYSVLVYDTDGRFICEALDRAHHKIAYGVHPAVKLLGTEEQKQELADALELKKRQEREASGRFDLLLNATVIPETRARQQAVEARLRDDAVAPDLVKVKPAPELTDEEFAAQLAEHEADRALQPEVVEPEDDYQPRVITAEEQFWRRVDLCGRDGDRYEMIMEAEAQNMDVPAEHRDFCKYFEESQEYAQFRTYFEDKRVAFAMMYRQARPTVAAAQ
ncbi:MAG: transposase [Opitutae bacterium]|nr:transposase [Opitutae bacterium]